jgi:hypothetical protein
MYATMFQALGCSFAAHPVASLLLLLLLLAARCCCIHTYDAQQD